MLRISLFLIFISIMSCSQKKNTAVQSNAGLLKIVQKLPKSLKETSGITLSADQNNYWVIEDHGNKNVIYGLDFNADIIAEIKVKGIENNDWEDITNDSDGFTYIGDFGNNDNERKDLAIYKIKIDASQEETEVLQTTTFSYPEQKDFPPKKNDLLYDCEAFIVYKGHFYLFTKNRSKNFDGTFLVYKVLNKNGDGNAALVGTIKLDGKYSESAITSAVINQNQDQIFLLSHSNIFKLTDFTPDHFDRVNVEKISLNDDSQKEAITFKGDNTLIIADERTGDNDGNIYEFKLK